MSRTKRQMIAEVIRDRITRGEYLPHSRLPSQLELAAEFHVTNRTVAQAIAVLRVEGYVWTLSHRGTYVHAPEHWRCS